MTLELPSSAEWAARCEADTEFMLAARHWTGGLHLGIGDNALVLGLQEGKPCAPHADTELVAYKGPVSTWDELLAAVPGPGNTDLMATLSLGGGLTRSGNSRTLAQYHAAIMRAVELLRPDASSRRPLDTETGPAGRVDAPVGRYVHVQVAGQDHRVYFEEAGKGIPLLLQHTAGAHGSQWRHLFEVPEITERFRVIAYDLPFHGKSLPPVSRQWWSEEYMLRGEFLREFVLSFSRALGLDRPVFMGCSVGGLLALDLAFRHAKEFRAVISLQGALYIEGAIEQYQDLWSPQISNDYKARVMEGVMSPTSPKAYRKETSYVYAGGWPATFIGDLFYYLEDFDLRQDAQKIDASKVAVHILSGEYDYNSTPEMGRAAHAAIPGSTWTLMKDVGHFAMSENPEALLRYLLPILRNISQMPIEEG